MTASSAPRFSGANAAPSAMKRWSADVIHDAMRETTAETPRRFDEQVESKECTSTHCLFVASDLGLACTKQSVRITQATPTAGGTA